MLVCNNYNNAIRWQENERLEQLFEAQCDHFDTDAKYSTGSTHLAVISNQGNYSYKALDNRANQLARYLRKQGVKSGDRVGILLHPSINTYVSLLAILKVNAAYVPLAPGFPKERISFIAEDAALSAIVTSSDFEASLEASDVSFIFLDTKEKEILLEKETRLSTIEKGEIVDNLCYIIYTSGSTGNPKGVAIEHPSICNFVKVAAEVYGMKETDRVYQGMTIAFDFSVEEIWVPFVAGATLVQGKSNSSNLSDNLSDFLRKHEVSAMCCVPTLLSMIEEDVPSLRLLIVGGEACPHDLVVRWHREGRTILNTYGPTEATVTATWTQLHPDKPVTIGQPLPTYTTIILDEQQQPVVDGELGEICLAGIGLARGYVNRDDLTQEYFIPDTLNMPNNPSKRIYRTGDLGRVTPENEIEYLGRIDTQVKIRGYRIELTEIESVLLQIPEIHQVVASTFTTESNVTELVAYYTRKDNKSDISAKISKILKEHLPGYMIPSFIEELDEIPMLPSDKADRKKLPDPKGPRFISSGGTFVEAKNTMEEEIAHAVSKALGIERVSVEDNLFEDLGCHSLVIAQTASELRKRSKLSLIGLSDFYQYPTVRLLANYALEKIKEDKTSEAKINKTKEEVYQASDKQVRIAGTIQFLFMFTYGGILTIPSLWIFNWILHHVDWIQGHILQTIWYGTLISTVGFFLSMLIPLALKWLLLGHVKEGKHKLWGSYFLRWWMTQKALSLSPHTMFRSTGLINVYYRLLGAKIGKDTMLDTTMLQMPDLISIGSQCSIGHSSQIFAYEVSNGFLHFKKVTIADRCFVGSNSILMPGSQMQDNSWLGDQSLISKGDIIPQNESWAGSPAVKEKEINQNILSLRQTREQEATPSKMLPGVRMTLIILFALPFVLGFVISFAAIPSLAIIVGAYFLSDGYWFLLSTPFSGLAFVLLLSLNIVIAKKILMPKITEGIYSINSFQYIQKRISDDLQAMSLGMNNALYATVYLPPFLRLLGAKIGKHAEISTVSHITPSLLEIGDESFVADVANVGSSYCYMGYFGVKSVKIGKRAFVGNAAFVPGGSDIADESLIGVLSLSPTEKIEKGAVWLGSPAFYLPRRQPSQVFNESLTFSPTRELYIKRLAYEFFRIILPPTLFSFMAILLFFTYIHLLLSYPLWLTIVISPWILLLSGITVTTIVILIKKLLVGTYSPKVKPLWDIFIRRTELVTGLYENVVVPSLLSPFLGTPFAAPILRAMGVKIGKRCYIETTFITEFELVDIGNDCSIGTMCSLQTHLFEDRVMKMSTLKISDGCSIGPRAVVLYDAVLEKGVNLDALSLVMKGEVLPQHTQWKGSPSEEI